MDNAAPSVRFVNEVRSNFAFLIETYGFHIAEWHIARHDIRDLTFVQYESSTVFIMPNYDNFSGEMGLSLGRITESDKVGADFTINELIAIQSHEVIPSGFNRIDRIARTHDEIPQSPYFGYMTHQADLVPHGVALLAADLQRYGIQALRNDPLLFAILRREREQRAQSGQGWGRQLTLRQTRERAEAAWRKGNYAEVVSLYGQISDDLSAAERKKLAYAQSKM